MMATPRQKNNTGAHEEGAGEAGERLKGHREQLRRLQQATDAVAGLRERVLGLEKRVSELQLESASLLDSDGQEKRESALITTLGVIEAKASRAREKLGQAEAGLEAQKQAVRGEFSRLFLIFKLWQIEREKQRLLGRMISGAPVLSVEQVVINLRSIVELSRLEVNAQSVEALVGQAERLLEAIQREPEFVVPPATRTASESVAVSSASEPRLYGPYLFRGMNEREIQTELARIRTENPGMDMAGATRRLSELHPELFSTEAEVTAMNAPLSGLATGIYEERKGGGYKLYVEPIGSTTAE
jgi:hypothetical protein